MAACERYCTCFTLSAGYERTNNSLPNRHTNRWPKLNTNMHCEDFDIALSRWKRKCFDEKLDVWSFVSVCVAYLCRRGWIRFGIFVYLYLVELSARPAPARLARARRSRLNYALFSLVTRWGRHRERRCGISFERQSDARPRVLRAHREVAARADSRQIARADSDALARPGQLDRAARHRKDFHCDAESARRLDELLPQVGSAINRW